MKKKTAVMLADTRPALVGHMLLQIYNTNRELFDEVIILDNGLSEKDKKIMQGIMPCRFIPYSSPISSELLKMEKFKRFSLIMFGRYEMFRLLNEYSLIMWIDTDVVIQGSLKQLLLDTETYGLSILREDPENKSGKNVDHMRTNFFRPVAEFDMNSYLCCTGLIIVRDILEQKCDYTQWCYEKTIEWAENLNLPDQGVINALIQNFKIDIYPIGHQGKYGCYPYIGRDCKDAIVVHSWGTNKFWNNYYLNRTFPIWEEVYQTWLRSGGSPLERKPLPQVSVVIPVYKPDLGYFKQCIDSLIDQKLNDYESYSDFEVIIVAEPFEKESIQSFVESYHDVRLNLYFNSERLGIAASLNRGMKLAKGSYIARIDDDDIAAPFRFQKQVCYLDEHPEVVLCTTDYLYFGDMNDGRVAMEGDVAKAWSVLTCPFDHPTIMFRKEFFLQNHLFYDENRKYVEDWELWQRAFKENMTVGCIHDILFYHRWHTGSAGQSNDTSTMMREMIQNNFKELGVNIPDLDVALLSPWSGKVTSELGYKRLEQYFREAFEHNNALKLYDPFSLAYVFSLRLTEAYSGHLDAIIIKRTEEPQSEEHPEDFQAVTAKFSIFTYAKGLLKKWLKRFYQPFRHRYEDRLIEIQCLSNDMNSNLARIYQLVEQQAKQANVVAGIVDDHVNALSRRLLEESETRYSQFSSRINEQMENTKNQLIDSMREENETTRQELSAKTYTEAENTRQEMAAKIYTEAENTRQEMSAKIYTEAENTRQEMAAKIYTEAENTRQEMSAKVYTGVENSRQELHRHIDFTYRDIMIATERQKSYLPCKAVNLITDYPVAYESLDHLYPHGTIRDNTRYPRFIKKCEELLGRENGLAFLDLGCSGGGMVLDAALRGHLSIGLEGSDCSAKELRAEWRLLGERLKTCDITKPFRLEQVDGTIQKFDIITAWEVMEHISEDDLPQLFRNIQEHLSDDGYFIASIANWDDIDPKTGVNWHVTVHAYAWWKARFEQAGFVLSSDLLQPIDLARGGYNPPHCYEAPYTEIDPLKTFYVVAHKIH